jgi:hypothetical protein
MNWFEVKYMKEFESLGYKEHKHGTGKDEYISSLYKHSTSTGHKIDYENVEILDKASTDNKLLLKEMLHINKLKPTLNKQKVCFISIDHCQQQDLISIIVLLAIM